MKRKIAYWTTTGLLGFSLLASGLMKLSGAPPLLENMAHLGYPPYLLTILGLWMVAGGAVLLAPGLPRLKEWAYAGVIFQMTGAFASHMFAGDPVGPAMPALLLAAVAVASYVLRPAARTLGEPVLPEANADAEGTMPTRGTPQPA